MTSDKIMHIISEEPFRDNGRNSANRTKHKKANRWKVKQLANYTHGAELNSGLPVLWATVISKDD